MKAQGWHRIVSGWYEYTNRTGKTLAYVQREATGEWSVTVLPMADVARAVKLKDPMPTLAQAKERAQDMYRRLSAVALDEQREALKKNGH